MLNFLTETFTLGLKNLHLHKLRSLLTALGIILGVAAVIIMVAIGEGAKQMALDQLKQLGAQNILVRSIRPPETSEASSRSQRTLSYGLKKRDLELLRTLPGIELIVPLRDTEQQVTRNDTLYNVRAIGAVPEIFTIIRLNLERGRLYNQVDEEAEAAVCVLGATAAKQIFPYADPLGQTITVGTSGISSRVVTVIGVLEPTGLRAGSEGSAMMKRDLDLDVYFPLKFAQSAYGDTILKRQAGTFERKQIEYSEIWLQAEEGVNVEALSKAVAYVVEEPRKRTLDVEISAPIQILRRAEKMNRTFNIVIGGIASISLIIGGIGIMNIMLASVTERTKEVGIRRALGAKRRHITLQFLIETTVISLTGGLIGIGLGAGLATLLPAIVAYFGAEYPTSVATWSVIGSFAVSGVIGIGFGLYPAMMAARMNPIEALRHE